MNRRRSLVSLLAAALLVVPLSACAMGSGFAGSADSGASGASTESRTGVDLPSDAADAGTAIDSVENPDGSTAAKSVIQNGDLSVTVSDPEAAAAEVAKITEDLGGYIESQSVSAAGDGITANATLAVRVPADQVDAAFEALAKVGDVTSQNRSSTDVTTEHVDLKARVAALKESVKRLTELMTDSASTGELIEAEAALSQRQQELDGLTAQLKALEGQVDEATIWVSLTTQSVVVPGGPTNFWDGLLAGLASMSAAGAGALVVLGVLLPWLVLGGVVALIVVLIVRAARRRSSSRRHSARSEPQPVQPDSPAQPDSLVQAGEPAPRTDPAQVIDHAYPAAPPPPHTPGHPGQNW